jgi:hypothetical protein
LPTPWKLDSLLLVEDPDNKSNGATMNDDKLQMENLQKLMREKVA